MNPQQVGCSPGESLERLYEKVFEEIYPQIKNHKKGVLSTVVYIILGENNKSQAQELCQGFKINSKSSLNDDLSISSDIIGLFITNPNDEKRWIIDRLKQGVKNARQNFGNNLESDEMKLYHIVIIGCILLGVIACIAYLKAKQKKAEVEKEDKIQPSKPKIPQPATLCVVVPASVVGNLKNNHLVNVSEIQEFIDNASYFLCTIPENANATQQLLELTDEDISNASETREVYVRIDIDDGEEMIGKKVPFILKRNLPGNGEFVITELACLKYLSNSGLEKFNRV